eukprot:GEZU01021587.1.p1 GENE.GEZU01021587.1~~GEZU01021587.1.p1  ORF type:complete len:295 (+),score=40.20 GEZU01021587.1:54-938(+)
MSSHQPHGGPLAISECLRILKDGGKLAIRIQGDNNHLREILQAVGLHKSEYFISRGMCKIIKPNRPIKSLRDENPIQLRSVEDTMWNFLAVGSGETIAMLPLRVIIFVVYLAICVGLILMSFLLWGPLDEPTNLPDHYTVNSILIGFLIYSSNGIPVMWRSMQNYCRSKSDLARISSHQHVSPLGLIFVAIKTFVIILAFNLGLRLFVWLPCFGLSELLHHVAPSFNNDTYLTMITQALSVIMILVAIVALRIGTNIKRYLVHALWMRRHGTTTTTEEQSPLLPRSSVLSSTLV